MKNFKFKIDGVDYEVSVEELENNQAQVCVNGKNFNVELQEQEAATVSRPATVSAPTASASRKVAGSIKAPLPGSIIKVLVSAGASVKRGDVLLTMESMKMENNVCAEADGVVKNVVVKSGQSVMQDDLLIEFESSASAEPAPTPAPAPAPKAAPKPASKPAASASGKPLKAPLPGSIIKILVAEGASVKRGDVLLTMESMKMENNICAEADGVVKSIVVKAGQSVMQDDDLLILG